MWYNKYDIKNKIVINTPIITASIGYGGFGDIIKKYIKKQNQKADAGNEDKRTKRQKMLEGGVGKIDTSYINDIVNCK